MPADTMDQATPVCGRCQAELSFAATEGLCPKCIFERALNPDEPTVLNLREARQTDSLPATPFTRTRLRYFGDYELLEEIARGGMGVVFKARQVNLNRLVALKLINSGALASEAIIKRFKAEAEAAAVLSHPNIVPIYEIGEVQGQHYFSMALIEGQNLREYLHHHKLSPRQSAEIIITIARAVHHAHQHGVLHRDIKPGNILIDKSGTPHLTDFGLAKIVQHDSTLTHTNAILGTPSYMAPEQARGETKRVTTAADVYGLGAVLYESVTTQPPFAGGTSYETIRRVLDEEPRPPSQWNRKVDRDLDTICLKCLEKEPARRYASAEALADDLRRWQCREPIQARPVTAYERLSKWAQRKPAAAALAAVSVLALTALAGVAISVPAYRSAESARRLEFEQRNTAEKALAEAQEARTMEREARTKEAQERQIAQAALAEAQAARLLEFEQRNTAEKALAEAQEARTKEREARKKEAQERQIARAALAALQKSDYAKNISLSARESLAGDTAAAESLLDDCALELRGWEWLYLKRLCFSGQDLATNNSRILQSVSLKRIYNVQFIADGTRLIAQGDGGAVFLDTATGREVSRLKALSQQGRLAVAPAADLLAVASRRHATVLHSPEGQEIALEDGYTADIAFSPDGTLVATAQGAQRNGGRVALWDSTSGTLLHTFLVVSNGFSSVRFSPDGKLLVAAEGDYRGSQWPSKSLLPNRRTGTIPRPIHVWNLATRKLLHSLDGHQYAVWRLAFTPDNQRLISASGPYAGGAPGEIKVWDLQNGKELCELRGHRSCVFSLAVSPDGKRLASAGGVIHTLNQPTEIRIWDLEAEKEIFSLRGHTSAIYDLAFSPSGDHLASASNDGTVRLWDATPTPRERQIDLSSHFNAFLWDSWHYRTQPSRDGTLHTFAGLPQGLQRFGGIRFDVRGIIQLSGRKAELDFPEKITGILIGHSASKIHFLHATGGNVPHGTQIGSYVVHYANGQSRQAPIIYGEDLREWHGRLDPRSEIVRGTVAWSGAEEKGKHRLFQSTWSNPLPDTTIRSVDFVSAMTACFPFLIAITLE